MPRMTAGSLLDYQTDQLCCGQLATLQLRWENGPSVLHRKQTDSEDWVHPSLRLHSQRIGCLRSTIAVVLSNGLGRILHRESCRYLSQMTRRLRVVRLMARLRRQSPRMAKQRLFRRTAALSFGRRGVERFSLCDLKWQQVVRWLCLLMGAGLHIQSAATSATKLPCVSRIFRMIVCRRWTSRRSQDLLELSSQHLFRAMGERLRSAPRTALCKFGAYLGHRWQFDSCSIVANLIREDTKSLSTFTLINPPGF